MSYHNIITLSINFPYSKFFFFTSTFLFGQSELVHNIIRVKRKRALKGIFLNMA